MPLTHHAMPPTFALRDSDASDIDAPLLGILLQAGTDLPPELRKLDESLGGALTRSLERGDFKGGRDESLHLDGAGGHADRLLLVGVGTPTEPAAAYRRGASLLGRQAQRTGAGALAVAAPGSDPALVESIVVGIAMGAWQYEDMKSPPAVTVKAKALPVITRPPRFSICCDAARKSHPFPFLARRPKNTSTPLYAG